MAVAASAQSPAGAGPSTDGLVPRFAFPESGPLLERTTTTGSFFDVVGRRAAVFGYENRPFEAWVYPLKILEDARLTFNLEDYPVPSDGLQIMRRIEVRPEATTLVYTHPAFTVRQTILAPIDEPGIVMLLDVDALRPLTVSMSFRPDLGLMWPAGLMTGFVGFDAPRRRYFTGEETQRFYGVVGSPLAVDVSVQPYQEEPQDVPSRFEMRVTPEVARDYLVPVVVAGSTTGRADADAVYDRLLATVPEQFEATAAHYRRLDETMRVDTPDDRLDRAFAWAKVGMDKGLATNPDLGTGLVAGYRTSGNSERPGFAWFFGRDALWTALATTAVGDYPTTRDALSFLAQFQRADGKVPHEISQSAAFLDWFQDYPYPWASADATPLFVVALADYYRQSGDLAFVREHWPAAQRAFAFTAATDTDGNGLVENTGVGHGWVEGGALYPPHEELYQQALFVQAGRDLAELAAALGTPRLGTEAGQAATRTLAAVEATYWHDADGFYAMSTAFPGAPTLSERAGPLTDADMRENNNFLDASNRDLGDLAVVRENTALQGVPLWWNLLDDARAQQAVTAFGGAGIATDWGARILDKNSDLYDPLSYHNGSVWALFTGWTSAGRLPLRPPPRRRAGALRQRLADGAGRAGLRHRAALGRLQHGVRALQPPPGLERGHGRDAARPRPAGPRRVRRRADGPGRAPAPGRLGVRDGRQRAGRRRDVQRVDPPGPPGPHGPPRRPDRAGRRGRAGAAARRRRPPGDRRRGRGPVRGRPSGRRPAADRPPRRRDRGGRGRGRAGPGRDRRRARPGAGRAGRDQPAAPRAPLDGVGERAPPGRRRATRDHRRPRPPHGP